MKQIKLLTWIALLGILLIGGAALAGQNGNRTASDQQTLSAIEAQNLVFLREEEKLARDVYLYLFEEWGQWIFENIAASEQKHMDAVKNLLDKYNLTDPADGNAAGVFTDPQLQELYNTLIDEGSVSNWQALNVGATIEDMDIFDLQDFLAKTKKTDVTRVLENLMKGSRNHLRAFVGQMELLGETYVAQYLDQDEIDAIVDSPREIGAY